MASGNQQAFTRRRVGVGIATAMLLCVPVQAAEQTIVVLDGSGSMWGRIDGRPKLEIARETLADALSAIPDGTEIGLMAYGHNRKGDCNDIEMLVAPRAGAAPAIVEAAGDMKFLGMTPLSAAVTRAAETMRHTEQKATVVLVTDGLETCDLDPCAVGTTLEASGIDFTAHVVGFGLSAQEGEQVACLATNTGGRYIAATDAASLAQALGETVATGPEPPAPEPEAPAAPAAELQAPEAVPMALPFNVDWIGPGAERDEVRIVDPDANHGKGRVVDGARVKPDDGAVVGLDAPAVPGDYELQYFSAHDRAVLATRPIRVDMAEVTLSAPEAVPMALPFDVDWTGPGAERDEVQLVDPGANHGKGRVLHRARVRPDDSATVAMIAPAEAGDYRLRYYNVQYHEVLATRPIRVDAVEVSLSAPEAVPMASSFDVDWIGPGAERDEVQIFDPDANHGKGRVVDRARVRPDDSATVAIDAPAEAGDYRLRYYNNQYQEVLATRPIRVDPVEVSLAAPDAVPAGTPVDVAWIGPGAERDEVRIVDPDGNHGKGRMLARARLRPDVGNTVVVQAPDAPGVYELQYHHAIYDKTLSTRPLTVQPAE